MSEAIIVACITGVVTLIGVLISNGRSEAIQTERIEQLRTDIARVEKKQDQHYELVGKIPVLEEKVLSIEKKIGG